MGIIVKNVPIEAHAFIWLVKYYHRLLYWIYNIMTTKLLEIKPKLVLPMLFKALNDTVWPNNLVVTLLIFGAYLCMTDIDAPLPTINQQSIAISKAIEEIRRFYAFCQVNNCIKYLK